MLFEKLDKIHHDLSQGDLKDQRKSHLIQQSLIGLEQEDKEKKRKEYRPKNKINSEMSPR